jgi:hypothetical protein
MTDNDGRQAMTLSSLVQVIGAVLSPVVMVTCCSIFTSAMFGRYESLSARMRALHRERLDLLAQTDHETGADEERSRETRRIEEIEHQLPGMLGRHRSIRNAILAVAAAMLTLVSGMFLIAAAELTRSTAVAGLALAVFLLATGVFLAGVAISTHELWHSQREVAFEIEDGLRIR